MMKLFSALIALVFFSLVTPVYADFDSAYNDYTFNYSKYRDSYNAYQISKSTYTTYKTLTAQADAINKLRTVITDRDKVMASYYDLLQEKLLATPGISQGDENTFFQMKESEKQWMADHQKKIDAAASLEDLNNTSSVFLAHYPQMDLETKQAVGMVLLSKEAGLMTRFDASAEDISSKLKEINLAGENTVIGERAVISAKNKKDAALTKVSVAQGILTAKDSSKIDLFAAQQRLSEANQYLSEAVSYLSEIIKGVTG